MAIFSSTDKDSSSSTALTCSVFSGSAPAALAILDSDSSDLFADEESAGFSSPTLFNPLNISMDFLISTIEDTIVSYEELPVSYNQIMVRGTLRYCAKLLNKIYDYSDKLLVEKIKRFIILIENLRNQYGVFTTFAHLDLTYIENMFEDIEEEASKKGYLPKLEDM